MPTVPPSQGIIRLRVRYNECDPMGFVHHAAYWPWLEMGRTELLRQSGVSYAQLENEGVLLVIIAVEARYRRSARYDDVLEVRTRVTGGGRVKIKHSYEVVCVEPAPIAGVSGPAPAPPTEPTLLMTAETTLGCIGRDGRARELPPWLTPNL